VALGELYPRAGFIIVTNMTMTGEVGRCGRSAEQSIKEGKNPSVGRGSAAATESCARYFQSQRRQAPYRRAEDLSRYEEGLRQAGLPE
jgi:hypothetical protein